MMRLIQTNPGCSDFDVVPADTSSPEFRVLLPEWIRGKELFHEGVFHTIPGHWSGTDDAVAGHFPVDDQLDVEVKIETGTSDISVELGITNVSSTKLTDLRANICTSVNHLPGNPDWSNRRFLPDVELDRSIQGRYWFETITPHRLLALTDSGWKGMHPRPDDPDATKVPLYSFVPSDIPEAIGCAVDSADGGCFFYQAWDTPCRWCTPCPGNACMHLEPIITERLLPEKRASIHGRIGLFYGTRNALEDMIRDTLIKSKT